MNTDDFYRVLGEVSAAKTYQDIFTLSKCEKSDVLVGWKKAYRTRAFVIHPDTVEVWNRQIAGDAFDRLTELYDQAKTALQNCATGGAPQNVVFSTATATHKLHTSYDQWSDMAACYLATSTYHGGSTESSFIKVARTPVDNDLIGAEAAALDVLYDKGDPKRTMYYPQLIDTFGARLGGENVRANAVVFLDGFVNLEQVKQARPGGLDPLDAAWMWRRLLWALDYVHERRIVHGAVLPRNVMILPEQHGLVLVDWCYSTRARGDNYPAQKAIVGSYRDWYPEHVLQKKPANVRTDISLAARTFICLMGGDPLSGELPAAVPRVLRTYFKDTAQKSAKDVSSVALEYDEILKGMGSPYYPRKFRPFVL